MSSPSNLPSNIFLMNHKKQQRNNPGHKQRDCHCVYLFACVCPEQDKRFRKTDGWMGPLILIQGSCWIELERIPPYIGLMTTNPPEHNRNNYITKNEKKRKKKKKKPHSVLTSHILTGGERKRIKCLINNSHTSLDHLMLPSVTNVLCTAARKCYHGNSQLCRNQSSVPVL